MTSNDVFKAAKEELSGSSWLDYDDPAKSEALAADLDERDRVGRKTYGTPLMSHNGRDSLIDLYEELLDAYVYATQYKLEHEDSSAVRVVEDPLRHVHSLIVGRGVLKGRPKQPSPERFRSYIEGTWVLQ